MPDRINSVGGQVVLIANKKTQNACVIGWRSKQLIRVVHSSLGAEAYALLELFGDLKYIKAVLKQMYGTRMLQVPTIALTASRHLPQALHNIKSISDNMLVGTIVELKEAMAIELCAQEVRLFPKEFQLADPLTKHTASAEGLMRVLQTGKFELRGGWEVHKKTVIFSRTWTDLSCERMKDNFLVWAAFKITKEEAAARGPGFQVWKGRNRV